MNRMNLEVVKYIEFGDVYKNIILNQMLLDL